LALTQEFIKKEGLYQMQVENLKKMNKKVSEAKAQAQPRAMVVQKHQRPASLYEPSEDELLDARLELDESTRNVLYRGPDNLDAISGKCLNDDTLTAGSGQPKKHPRENFDRIKANLYSQTKVISHAENLLKNFEEGSKNDSMSDENHENLARQGTKSASKVHSNTPQRAEGNNEGGLVQSIEKMLNPKENRYSGNLYGPNQSMTIKKPKTITNVSVQKAARMNNLMKSES
jgi:hypothetical protein